jgi:hypothetical protein
MVEVEIGRPTMGWIEWRMMHYDLIYGGGDGLGVVLPGN